MEELAEGSEPSSRLWVLFSSSLATRGWWPALPPKAVPRGWRGMGSAANEGPSPWPGVGGRVSLWLTAQTAVIACPPLSPSPTPLLHPGPSLPLLEAKWASTPWPRGQAEGAG